MELNRRLSRSCQNGACSRAGTGGWRWSPALRRRGPTGLAATRPAPCPRAPAGRAVSPGGSKRMVKNSRSAQAPKVAGRRLVRCNARKRAMASGTCPADQFGISVADAVPEPVFEVDPAERGAARTLATASPRDRRVLLGANPVRTCRQGPGPTPPLGLASGWPPPAGPSPRSADDVDAPSAAGRVSRGRRPARRSPAPQCPRTETARAAPPAAGQQGL